MLLLLFLYHGFDRWEVEDHEDDYHGDRGDRGDRDDRGDRGDHDAGGALRLAYGTDHSDVQAFQNPNDEKELDLTLLNRSTYPLHYFSFYDDFPFARGTIFEPCEGGVA